MKIAFVVIIFINRFWIFSDEFVCK